MAYDMDEQTHEHLYRWMARNARIGASILDETDKVVTFLQELDQDEAARYLNEDWALAYRDAQEHFYAVAGYETGRVRRFCGHSTDYMVKRGYGRDEQMKHYAQTRCDECQYARNVGHGLETSSARY